MRSIAIMFASLMIGVAAIAAMAGCSTPAPAPAQAQVCPPAAPWVAADYANGKWVPGHCLGQPAQ